MNENIVRKEEMNAVLNSITSYVKLLGHNLDNSGYLPTLTNVGEHHFHINFLEGKNDLYIRFGMFEEFNEKVIIVARIGFNNPRHGFGTALISNLVQIAEKYNYKKISFECPNKDCIAFAKKIGFDNARIQSVEKIKEVLLMKNCL